MEHEKNETAAQAAGAKFPRSTGCSSSAVTSGASRRTSGGAAPRSRSASARGTARATGSIPAVWKRDPHHGGGRRCRRAEHGAVLPRQRSVEVDGLGTYYTADEITRRLRRGSRATTCSRSPVRASPGIFMAELPYVSTVQVTRRLPDTLELTVTEYDVTYAAQGADGASAILSRRTARSRKRSTKPPRAATSP